MSKTVIDVSLNPIMDEAKTKDEAKKIKNIIEDSIGDTKINIDNSELTKSSSILGTMGEHISGMGKGLANFGLMASGVSALSDSLISISQPFVQLDTATAQMRTLGPEAAAMSEQLKGVSLQLSKELPFAAGEFQSAMGDAMASGVQGGAEALANFAQVAAKLATGGNAELGAVVQGLGATLNAFGATADDAGKYADYMFNTVNAGVTTIDELNQYLSGVTPTAASMGLAFDKVGGSLALMTQKGVPTASAVTKLNSLLVEMAKPTAGITAALKGAGISLEDFHQMVKDDNLVGALSTLQKGFDATGKTATQAFGSSEASAAFNVLMGDVGLLESTLDAVSNTTGSTENAYAQMAQSIEVQTKQMKAQFDAFTIGIMQGAGDFGIFASVAAQGFAEIAPSITALTGLGQIMPTSAIKSMALTLTKTLIPSLVATDVATGVTSFNFSKVSASAKGFAKSLSSVSFGGGFVNGLKQLGTTLIGVLVPSFATAGTAGAASGTATSAAWSPVLVPILAVGAAIAAIAGAFYLLYQNSEGFRDFIDGLINTISDFSSMVWDGLVSTFSSIWDYVKEPLSYLGDALKAVGIVVGLFVIAPFYAMYEALKFVFGYVADFAIVVWDGLVSALKSIGEFLSNVFIKIWETLTTVFSKVAEFVKNVFIGVWNGLAAVFNVLIYPIKKVIEGVGFLTQAFQGSATVGIYVKGILSGVASAGQALGETMAKAWNSIKNLDFKGFLNAIADAPKKIFDAFKNGTSESIAAGNQMKKVADDQKKAEQDRAKAEKDKKAAIEKTNAESEKEVSIKKKSAATDKAKEISILEQYNLTKKKLEQELQSNESAKEQLRLKNDLKKSAIDDLQTEQAKIDKIKLQKVELDKLISNAGGSINSDGIIVGAKLNDKQKEELQKELDNVLADLNKSQSSLTTLSIKADIDLSEAEKNYQIYKLKQSKEVLKIKLDTGEISLGDFNTESLKLYSQELTQLQTQLNELEVSKGLANSIQKIDIQKEIDGLTSTMEAKAREISDIEGSIWAETQLKQIKATTNGLEQQKAIELFLLEQTYQEKLNKVAFNEQGITDLLAEEAAKRAEIEKKYVVESPLTKYYKSIGSAFQDAFSNMDFSAVFKSNDELKKQLEDISSSQSDLEKQYKNGELAYAEYVDALNSIDEKRTETMAKQGDKQKEFWKAANAGVINGFATMITSTQSDLSKTRAKMAEDNATNSEILKGTMEGTASVFAMTSLSMIASGKSLWKSLTLGLLAALKAQAPVLIAMITGIELGSKGFGGLVTIPVLSGILMGLISIAEAAVSSAKFAKGGLVTGGEQLITINEKGQEFVLNANATKKNLSALMELNNRDITVEQYAKEHFSSSLNIDTTKIERRLELIETAIKQEARFKTHIDANIEINDKEIVKRAEFQRTKSVRRF